MESFHQIELIMMSKMEPTSPSSSSSSNEDIIYEDNYANDHFINELNAMDELMAMEHKKNVADILCELEGDKYLSEEFQSTSDKLDLPLYDFVQSIAAPELVINHPMKTIASTVSNNSNNNSNNKIKTEQLLMEFDSIYDELTHLTPPQTPPGQQFYLQNAQEEFNEQQQQQFMYSPVHYQQQNSPVQQQYIYDQSATTSSSASLNDQEISIFFDQNNLPSCSANNGAANFQDLLTIDQEAIMTSPTPGELEVVAELLYSHTEKQSNHASTSTSNADWNTDDDCSTGFSSSSFSPRSDSSSVFSQDDDEPKKKSKSGLRGVSKKRTRPYARGNEDKKSRKKEQNKNAATRYRQKKKQEVEVILDEERILMNKNDKLMDTFQDTRREVKYLKSLLRDLFKARGFIQ